MARSACSSCLVHGIYIRKTGSNWLICVCACEVCLEKDLGPGQQSLSFMMNNSCGHLPPLASCLPQCISLPDQPVLKSNIDNKNSNDNNGIFTQTSWKMKIKSWIMQFLFSVNQSFRGPFAACSSQYRLIYSSFCLIQEQKEVTILKRLVHTLHLKFLWQGFTARRRYYHSAHLWTVEIFNQFYTK